MLPTALAAQILLTQDREVVNEELMTTYQKLSPAGQSELINARPVDIAVSSDGKLAWVKDSTGVKVFDADEWKQIAELASPGGSSLTGLELDPSGKSAWFTNSQSELHNFTFDGSKITLAKTIKLTAGKGASFPCGLLVKGDTAWVCLSRANQLAKVNLKLGKIESLADTGIAPYDIAIDSKGIAYVTCMGGMMPKPGAKTAPSAGTETEVDERGVAKGGCLSVIPLDQMKKRRDVPVGLQPSGIIALPDGRIAVAASNADEIGLYDPAKATYSAVSVRPDKSIPFGTMPNALAISPDRKSIYAACAGLNAVAVVNIASRKVTGYIPTGWYPGSVVAGKSSLFVANVKGVGSRMTMRPEDKGRNSHDHSGSVQKVSYPSSSELSEYTKTAKSNAKISDVLSALERKGKATTKPVAFPKKLGDPSLIEHVIYVIKENRTYDQLFGDIKSGKGDPKLCIFPEKITPNHHALAKEFVLLDNYYCNGVLSADGHSWATEGNVTPYLEKAFGGFTRSYTYGDDPLTYSSTGFLWDYVLGAGRSFRNFGEFDTAEAPAGWKPQGVWRSFESGQDVEFGQVIGVERVRNYSARSFPGWNMAIPDVLRCDRFLTEFRKMEADGRMPNLTVVYFPQDHTAGTSPRYPTPASYLADNDLAIGRMVEAVSKSKFWSKTAIFINEDDPQAGFDHVDGHRSICLVVSPYTRSRGTVSQFYNQASVLRTILHLMGLPPMNQMVAASPLMKECFKPTAELASYSVRNPEVDLDAVNPPIESLSGDAKKWAIASSKIPLQRPGMKTDRDDDTLNRILWHAMKGYKTRYPAEWAGYHGRGLKKLGLKIDKNQIKDSDD